MASSSLAGAGSEGLAALELAIRTAMTKLGASLLEDLLAMDSGHRGPRVDCGAAHQAELVSYRTKTLDTVLGPIEYRRAYYHCSDCGHRVVPATRSWDWPMRRWPRDWRRWRTGWVLRSPSPKAVDCRTPEQARQSSLGGHFSRGTGAFALSADALAQ